MQLTQNNTATKQRKMIKFCAIFLCSKKTRIVLKDNFHIAFIKMNLIARKNVKIVEHDGFRV